MPSSDSKLKKKDTAVLEIGRPFSPVMFESVLKSFTPDVPNSISGRPRFVCFLHQFYFDIYTFYQSQVIFFA